MEQKKFNIFKGITKIDRFKSELKPHFVQIDDRELPQMLEFIRKYTKKINFYNLKNLDNREQEISNWGPYFVNDDVIILIQKANFRITTFENTTQQLLDEAHMSSNQKIRVTKSNELVRKVLFLAEQLNGVRKNFYGNKIVTDLILGVKNLINQELNYYLAVLYNYKIILQWDNSIEKRFLDLFQDWGTPQSQENFPKEISNIELNQLKKIVNSFIYSMHYVIVQAKNLLVLVMNDTKNNKPHIALYITFLKLFKHAQDLQNKLPQKHLDFYYREVLKQQEKKSVPDQLFVSLTLASGVSTYFLEKGTQLDAGKTAKGDALHYEISKSISLSDTKIGKVCTLFKSTDDRYHQKPTIHPQFITSLHTAEIERTSKNGFSLNNLALFGEEQLFKSTHEKTMLEGKLGFAVESPILKLAKGKRKIELVLEFEKEGFENAHSILKEISENNQEQLEETIFKVFSTAFELVISQTKGTQPIDPYGFTNDDKRNSWIFDFELSANEDAIAPLEEEPELKNYPSYQDPFIEVKLKHECSVFLYSIIALLTVKNIRIRSTSEQLKDVVFYNNLGRISPNNPFELFGPIPKNNSYFIMGHQEAFSKNIEQLSLTLEWFSLPIEEGGIEAYYKEYLNEALDNSVEANINTSNYTLTPYLLVDGSWAQLPYQGENQLFINAKKNGLICPHQYDEKVTFTIDLSSFGYKKSDKNVDAYALDQNSIDGFLRFDLSCPEFAFGHEQYANLLSDTLWKNSKIKKKEKPLDLPKPPFSPKVEKITLNYSSSVAAFSNDLLSEEENIKFYHINPFGYKKIPLKSTDQKIPLMETDETEGNLLLGLSNLPATGELSLLFEMSNDEKDKELELKEQVEWSYLRDNIWSKFEKNSLLNDTTNGFVNSGIIQLKIPRQINRNNTVIDNRWFWIKASVFKNAVNLSKVNTIYENGVHAIWKNNVSSNHLEKGLPAFTISSFKDRVSGIDKVYQPIKSFHGKQEESSPHFYTRVSERLRHKSRAINALDYEQLVLEKFPLIYRVKCFTANNTLMAGHERYENLILPGSVRIAVIPDIYLVDDPARPKISNSTIVEITEYLSERISPFVKLIVCNPFYEQIRVICKVTFKGEESDGIYEEKLQTDIKACLNPWLTEDIKDDEFGSSRFRSELLSHIQNLEYVAYVTELSVVKIIENNGKFSLYDSAAEDITNQEEVKAIYPWSILVSAEKHDITVIHDPTYGSPKPRRLHTMELGTDFIILKDKNNAAKG